MLEINADELPRFMECNGSVRMEAAEKIVSVDTTVRDEGNAFHWLVEQSDPKRFVGQPAFNDVIITDDMVIHAQEWRAMALPESMVEHTTTYADPLKRFRVRGRTDRIAWQPSTGTMRVSDAKYGYRVVEPKEHWTMIFHAWSYAMTLAVVPTNYVLEIYQPRARHSSGERFRSHTYTPTEWEELVHRMHRTLVTPADTLVTGNHCRHCKAITTCPASRGAGWATVEVSTVTFDDTVDDSWLGQELEILERAQERLKDRVEALHELVKHRITSGQIVPGYALERQYANTRWKSAVTAEMVKLLTGVDISKPGMITPTQAKAKGVTPTVLESLAERPMTGAKLVRADADSLARRLLKQETQ
jgi:hypothetical protein